MSWPSADRWGAMRAHAMTSDVVRCVLDVPDSGVSVRRVYSLFLDEGISAPSRAVVRFPDFEREFKAEQFVGKPATLKLRQGATATEFRGVVTNLVLENSRDERSVYVAEIVDQFSACGPSRSYRVFERRDLKSIVTAVLQKSRVSLKFQATSSPIYPICVQYAESDYSFVSRLLEENGLYCWMVGNDLYVADDSTKAKDSGLECSYLDTLESFQVRHGVVPLEKRGLSYRYETEEQLLRNSPDVRVSRPGWEAAAQLYGGNTDIEIVEDTDGDALDRFTKVRGESAVAATYLGTGRSVLPTLRPGCVVSVKDLPRAELNEKYFVWRVVHDYSSSVGAAGDEASYGNSFWCIPSSMTFRPPRVQPVPRVYGLQVGTVVAPSSSGDEDAGKLGRVRVRLSWMGQDDLCQGTSFWARVLEGHAGENHGTVFIPEHGDEVLVAFEGGNVNSPVVLGGLYTGKRVPPVPMPPGHKNEQKIILTRSGNALLFEDLESGSRLSLLQKDAKNSIRLDLGKKIAIELSSEGSIRLLGTGQGEIVLEQGQGKIKIDAAGNVEISGPTVKVTGTAGDLTFKAPLIRLN